MGDAFLEITKTETNFTWKNLLVHEGSENTKDIEEFCTKLAIPVKYSNITDNAGFLMELMSVQCTDLAFVDLVILLSEKNLIRF